MGEMPVYNPRPIPPKDACVNPPLMNTSLRVTMYVPISPQAADRNVAYGMRARVNLVMNNWGEAATDAEAAPERLRVPLQG